MRLISLFVLSFSLLLAGSLAAQTPEERARAVELEDQGMALFSEGNFAEAAIMFQEAYNLDPHPVLMFNIGRAQLEMRDLPAALLFFRRVLALDPDEEVAGFAQARINSVSEELIAQGYDPDTVTSEEYIPRGTLVLTSVPEGASVFIDSVFSGNTPLRRDLVNEGTYEVRLTAEGYHPLTESVIVGGGAVTERELIMEARTNLDEYVPPSPGYLTVTTPRPDLDVFVDGTPIGASPVTAAPLTAGTYIVTVRGNDYAPFTSQVTIVAGEESRVFARMELLDGAGPPPDVARRNLAIGLIAGGGAVAVSGGVLGLLALDSASDYRLSPSDPDRGTARDRAKGLALGADLSIGVGLAVAAAGTVLLLTNDRPETDAAGVTFVPQFGRRSGGASVRLQF